VTPGARTKVISRFPKASVCIDSLRGSGEAAKAVENPQHPLPPSLRSPDVGLYPTVTFQCSSNTFIPGFLRLYHIKYLFF
jgi:hypothetical protein